MTRALALVSLCACTSGPLTVGATAGGAAPALVVSVDRLDVDEGDSGAFAVWLTAPPAQPLTVSVESTDPAALPVSPAQLRFTADSYTTPQTVVVSAPVDGNAVSEAATVTVSAPGLASLHLAASLRDRTQLEAVGWSTPFATYGGMRAHMASCLQLTLSQSAKLESFGLFAPVAPAPSGTFTMALYRDGAGTPGALVTATPAIALVDGVNRVDATAPTLAPQPLWLCVRFDRTSELGRALDSTALRCVRDLDLDSGAPWPDVFGSASCAGWFPENLWIATDHQ